MKVWRRDFEVVIGALYNKKLSYSAPSYFFIDLTHLNKKVDVVEVNFFSESEDFAIVRMENEDNEFIEINIDAIYVSGFTARQSFRKHAVMRLSKRKIGEKIFSRWYFKTIVLPSDDFLPTTNSTFAINHRCSFYEKKFTVEARAIVEARSATFFVYFFGFILVVFFISYFMYNCLRRSYNYNNWFFSMPLPQNGCQNHLSKFLESLNGYAELPHDDIIKRLENEKPNKSSLWEEGTSVSFVAIKSSLDYNDLSEKHLIGVNMDIRNFITQNDPFDYHPHPKLPWENPVHVFQLFPNSGGEDNQKKDNGNQISISSSSVLWNSHNPRKEETEEKKSNHVESSSQTTHDDLQISNTNLDGKTIPAINVTLFNALKAISEGPRSPEQDCAFQLTELLAKNPNESKENEIKQKVYCIFYAPSYLKVYISNLTQQGKDLFLSYMVFILFLFFFLPQVQQASKLLKNYSNGETDTCYFNYNCRSSLGIFVNLNSVLSCVPYFAFGIAFMISTYRKSRYHLSLMRQLPSLVGIAMHRQFSFYYLFSVSMIFQGCLSLVYYLCPNRDTVHSEYSFLFLILCIFYLMVRTKRQSKSSYGFTFMLLMVSIFLTFSFSYWHDFYSLLRIFLVQFILLVTLYALSPYLLHSFWREDSLNLRNPTFIFTLSNSLLNWLMIFWFIYLEISIERYIYSILIVNILVSMGYYLFMKHRAGEEITITMYILFFVTIFWLGGTVNLVLTQTAHLNMVPALSRDLLWGSCWTSYLDYRGLSHILIAFGLFIAGNAMLFIDDELYQHFRPEIPVDN